MMRTMVLLAIVMGLSGCGLFDDHNGSERTAMLQSKVSLSEAIAIAEKETGGKAIRASADDEDGAVLIKVAIVRDHQLQRVFIDTQTGRIVKTRNDDDSD